MSKEKLPSNNWIPAPKRFEPNNDGDGEIKNLPEVVVRHDGSGEIIRTFKPSDVDPDDSDDTD